MNSQFKKIMTVLLITFGMLSAQNGSLSVVNVKALTNPQQGAFYFPKFMPDNQNILFSGPRFTGLYRMDLKTKRIEQLTAENGAGYEYQISPDGKYVIYRSIQMENRRNYYSIKKLNLADKKEITVVEKARDLTPPHLTGNTILFLKNNVPQKMTIGTQILHKTGSLDEKAVFIHDRKIVLLNNGQEKVLQPLGPGIYIWPRLSPTGDRLLFTYAGDATYVCDLDGNILAKIGYANAAEWSPDGKWIAYMVDKDNGDYFTASEIYISDATGKQRLQVTNTPNIIEMYPNWSSDLSKLIFASDNGQIFMATLKIGR